MPATITGPRADLAAQITRVTQLTAECDELQSAAWRLPAGLVDAQEEAEEALKAARQRERQPATVLARARGHHVDGPTLAEAEVALAAANAAIAKAQEHGRTIAAIVPRAASDLDVATMRRDELIAEVIRTTPEVQALLAEHGALEVRLATVTALLGKLPATALPANTFFIRQPEPDKAAVAAVARWRSVLAEDAAAPFPNLDSPPAQQEAA